MIAARATLLASVSAVALLGRTRPKQSPVDALIELRRIILNALTAYNVALRRLLAQVDAAAVALHRERSA